MDLLDTARNRLAAIDKAIADLGSERADWKALIDAAEKLRPRLAAAAIQLAPAVSRSSSVAELVVGTAAQPGAGLAAKPTKKDQVISIALGALSGGQYVQAKDLADMAIAAGIDLGSDPTSYVSVLLSRDGRFKSERAKGGWHMNFSPRKEEAPSGVDAPAGPDLLDLQPASVTAGTGPTPD